MVRRLSPDIETGITSFVKSKGWEFYLFSQKTSELYPAHELDYDDSYAIFPPIQEYRGSFGIARKMQYPSIILNKESVFVWRKRHFSNRLVTPEFADVINLPQNYSIVILYFVPRERNIEVHMPRTVILADDSVIDIDGILMSYKEFIESMKTLQPV